MYYFLLKRKFLINYLFRLRTYHDGIMVGIGTIINEDPRLAGVYITLHTFCCRAKPVKTSSGSTVTDYSLIVSKITGEWRKIEN